MLIADINVVVSVTAGVDMRLYGISMDEIREAISKGNHEPALQSPGVYRARHVPDEGKRCVEVIYKRQPPESGEFLIARVFWTKP